MMDSNIAWQGISVTSSMDALQDLHFAAALAVVKAQTLGAVPTQQEQDPGQIAELQDELDRLRLENQCLKEQIEMLTLAKDEDADLPDSIFINLSDPADVNTIKQVDIIRSYIERCRDGALTSGAILIDIICDVISALKDPSIQQNSVDVAYAADWIGEGLDIAFGTDAPEDCVTRVAGALFSMTATFKNTDCFSEDFLNMSARWKQKDKSPYADIREQVMHFLIQLGKRSMISEFLLAGLCLELLAIFNAAGQLSDMFDHIRHSQNASFVCRAIECILAESRRSGRQFDESSVSDQLLEHSGLTTWVEIWPTILTAAVAICDKLPLATSFVWQLAAVVEGGSGTAWRTGLQELSNSIARK